MRKGSGIDTDLGRRSTEACVATLRSVTHCSSCLGPQRTQLGMYLSAASCLLRSKAKTKDRPPPFTFTCCIHLTSGLTYTSTSATHGRLCAQAIVCSLRARSRRKPCCAVPSRGGACPCRYLQEVRMVLSAGDRKDHAESFLLLILLYWLVLVDFNLWTLFLMYENVKIIIILLCK